MCNFHDAGRGGYFATYSQRFYDKRPIGNVASIEGRLGLLASPDLVADLLGRAPDDVFRIELRRRLPLNAAERTIDSGHDTGCGAALRILPHDYILDARDHCVH